MSFSACTLIPYEEIPSFATHKKCDTSHQRTHKNNFNEYMLSLKRLSFKILLFLLPTARRKGICVLRKNFVYLRQGKLWGKSRDKIGFRKIRQKENCWHSQKVLQEKLTNCLPHIYLYFMCGTYDLHRIFSWSRISSDALFSTL